MTASMIESWCTQWDAEGVPASASVQTPAQMQENVEARLAGMRAVADRLYARWMAGLGD